MELNREIKRLLQDKRIKKLRVLAEAKVGRPISDEEFVKGFYYALQEAERRRKKYV